MGSLVASQLLLGAADRRYDRYHGTVDPTEVETLYRDAQRFDRWSNALVVLGELSAAATLSLQDRNLFEYLTEGMAAHFAGKPAPSLLPVATEG